MPVRTVSSRTQAIANIDLGSKVAATRSTSFLIDSRFADAHLRLCSQDAVTCCQETNVWRAKTEDAKIHFTSRSIVSLIVPDRAHL